MSYVRETARGFGWMGGFRVASRLVALLRTVILARILLPAQFGLYGIATLVLAFLEVFTETGINVFLIQQKENLEKYIDTAWLVSIARGFLIALLILVCAPLVVRFFNAPGALNLVLLISLVSAIRGFISPARVKFQKELEFGKEFWIRMAIFTFDSAVAIVVALTTRTPASLVWGLIAGSVLEVILTHALIRPRPKLAFESETFKKIVSRGKWLTGAGIFEYLFRQGDDIVVGRFLGETSLGFYQMAYKVATLPVTEVADVFGKVTLPIYAKISESKKELKDALVKTTLATAALVLPGGLVLVIFTKLAVTIVLGEVWLPIVPVLKVLVIYAITRALVNPARTVFLAVKKQEYLTTVTFVSIVALAVAIFPLARLYGLVGIGLATIIASLASVPLVVYYTVKIFK
ncbi:hypothetical protein A2630_00035 [Candidatus Woesebacteria bacterium RIFCSPHIGHO2_01_FULL_44_10]|uniref:Polysaccharide biosynthesis protein C-terminal domain-containing protein n=1 Tax=Candidatus Woesebacteria bacterium RIFCSPLOWO2_01_FULL_44_14 TaxID=1802525 RepID=A0A1F8BYP8_9BACT|nr:MAG: hypothetical protein A2630_00035 [Candidatus Woesebacteria bacterium RIFCSPHIGHO2_01_FULL_44_10]OGM56263.1 MAG: hypothetical protein A3F62_03355 [Candidatus Woesebacteria bacterium RIFCSPHIGHO2_12_FULL_44_11]OGM68699.1 MAG: hypothetical protein A2975_05335 [Candidatus Woesebacteria bacterium RIFCSPLOWO2_01_FULL_44_14]